MKFKISTYETKKYKASKKKVLEFSEFKDIVDVDKKYVPLLYYFRKRLNFKDDKHDILKLKRKHIEELIEVLENRKLFKYYGDKKLWFGIFGEGFVDKKLENGKYLVNLVEFTEVLDEEKEEIKTKELKLQKENNRIKKINKTPLLKRFEISINDSIALVIMVYLGILAGKQYMWLQISLVTFCFIFCFYVMMPAFRIFRFLKKNDIKVGFVEFDRILDNIKNMREDATVNGHFYKKVYYKKVKRFIEKYKKFKGSFPENKKINKEQDLKKNFEEISEMLELDNGKVLNLEKED